MIWGGEGRGEGGFDMMNLINGNFATTKSVFSLDESWITLRIFFGSATSCFSPKERQF